MNDGQFLDGLNTLLIVKLSTTVVAITLFVGLRWAVRRVISNYATTHDFSPSRIASAHRAVSVIGFLAFASVLAIAWSISFHNFAVASGALVATIGVGFFATWSILSNLTSSIIMFWRFPMHVGDRIGLLDDKSFVAVVKEFTPFYIILEDDDGNHITLPNSLTLQQMFVIYKAGSPRRTEPASDEAGSDTGQGSREG